MESASCIKVLQNQDCKETRETLEWSQKQNQGSESVSVSDWSEIRQSEMHINIERYIYEIKEPTQDQKKGKLKDGCKHVINSNKANN